MKRQTSPDREYFRGQVLRALGENRTPGYHFPGHLLGCHWPRIGDSDLDAILPGSPVSRDAAGCAHLAAFSVLLDVALATSSRLGIARGARQATVHLHAQFTGAPLRGELLARARMRGYTGGSAVRESLTEATVYAGDQPVGHASGTFIVLPPPAGMTLAPLPWQREGSAPAPALDEGALSADEKRVMRACDSALRPDGRRHAFVERFWGALPAQTADGARCTIRIGPHHANRVGHVQGGLLLGLAADTARAAAPRHPRLSAVSAWFISPGQGRVLKIRSRRFHDGRSFAAVRTEVKNADGSRVLELLSHHAA